LCYNKVARRLRDQGDRRFGIAAFATCEHQSKSDERAEPFHGGDCNGDDMCGIIGYVGTRDVVPVLIGGLKKLEYRGYDSAGIAVVNGTGVEVVRAEGKLSNLEAKLSDKEIHGSFGMGHTRWATHGKPNENNAHPHRDCTGKVVV